MFAKHLLPVSSDIKKLLLLKVVVPYICITFCNLFLLDALKAPKQDPFTNRDNK